MKYRDGVAVGRFYPYHHGHRHMLQYALSRCERLHVIICGRDQQSIPAERRAEWIRADLPQVLMYLFDQDASGLPDRSAEMWAWAIENIIGLSPDALFASEPYQRECAGFMDAVLELVDPERTRVNISATRIRENPDLHRHMVTDMVWQDIQVGLADDQKCRDDQASQKLARLNSSNLLSTP